MAKQGHFDRDGDTRLNPNHRDYDRLFNIEAEILRHAKGEERFKADIPLLIRQAIDEVIDAPRSRRFLLSELESTEKTYLGTKIEILLRNYLKLSRGHRLDVLIANEDVDIKNTTADNWMIPQEAFGHVCILIREDEKAAKCWFGLVVIHKEILRPGRNRDTKSSIATQNLINIHWMLYGHSYPRNFWEDISPSLRQNISSPKSGTGKLSALFRLYTRRPVARQVLMALAPQKDTLKRVRKNGGARDILQVEGIALLSGIYDKELIHSLGLPHCEDDEFISIKPENGDELAKLQKAGALQASS